MKALLRAVDTWFRHTEPFSTAFNWFFGSIADGIMVVVDRFDTWLYRE